VFADFNNRSQNEESIAIRGTHPQSGKLTKAGS